jgi:hypothetical protein
LAAPPPSGRMSEDGFIVLTHSPRNPSGFLLQSLTLLRNDTS